MEKVLYLLLCCSCWIPPAEFKMCDILHVSSCGELLYPEYAEIGKPLNLTCSLNQNVMTSYGILSSSVRFKFKLTKFNSSNITSYKGHKVIVINETTAMFHIDKLELTPGGYEVCCIVKPRKQKHIIVARGHMHVGDLPYKPVMQDVFIYDWKNLTVVWDTGKSNPYFTTKYQVLYTVNSDNPYTSSSEASDNDWKVCSDRVETGKSSCALNDRIYFRNSEEKITAHINASNLLGVVYSAQMTKYVRQLIVPKKLEAVQYVVDKTSIQLTWNSSKPKQAADFIQAMNINYKVSYSSELITLTTSKMADITCEVKNLRPHIDYIIGVTSQAEGSQYWSEAFVLNITTLPDVPGKTPVVTPGGYFIDLKQDGDHHYRNIILFWKSIPLEWRNGIVTEYKIFWFDENNDNLFQNIVSVPNTDKGLYSYTVEKLALDSHYRFYIDARTTVGYNTSIHVFSPVNIPKENLLLQRTEVQFVVINNGSQIEVNWEPLPADHNMTVFWCKEMRQDSKVDCENEISWEVVDGTKGRTVISVAGTGSWMFGSSVSTDLGKNSSGIKWNNCLYDTKEVPPPPHYDIQKVTDYSVEMQLRKPDCSETHAAIDSYRVYYCIAKSQHSDTCQPGKEWVRSFDVGLSSSSSYKIDDLRPSTKYLFKLQSVARTKSSYNTTLFAQSTQDQDMLHIGFSWIWLLIVLFILIAIALTGLGVFACIRWNLKTFKVFFAPIPIATPDVQNIQGQIKQDVTSNNNYLPSTESEMETLLNPHRSLNGWDQTDIVPSKTEYFVEPRYQQTRTDTFTFNKPPDPEELENYRNNIKKNGINSGTSENCIFISDSGDNVLLQTENQDHRYHSSPRDVMIINPATIAKGGASCDVDRSGDGSHGYAHTSKYSKWHKHDKAVVEQFQVPSPAPGQNNQGTGNITSASLPNDNNVLTIPPPPSHHHNPNNGNTHNCMNHGGNSQHSNTGDNQTNYGNNDEDDDHVVVGINTRTMHSLVIPPVSTYNNANNDDVEDISSNLLLATGASNSISENSELLPIRSYPNGGVGGNMENINFNHYDADDVNIQYSRVGVHNDLSDSHSVSNITFIS